MRILVIAVLGIGLLHAEGSTPATVAVEQSQVRNDFLIAIDAAPEVRAAQARWRAAVMANGGAGALSDPRIWTEGTRRRDGDGIEIGVEQEFPRWGERSASRSVAAAATLRARVELDSVRARLAQEVAMLIATAQAAHRRASLADESATRMRTMIEIVEAAVAAGGMAGSGAGDVLALRTRLQQMELMAADERRMALDAEDDARGSYGLDAGATIPDLLLPDLKALDRSAATAVRLAKAEVGMAEAERTMAHSRRLPQFGIGAGWERNDVSMADEMWKVSLSMTIPLQQDRLAAGERAALANARAAEADAEQAELRIDIALRRAARAKQQAERAHLAAVDAGRRSEAEFSLLMQQVSAGSSDAVMRALLRLDDLQSAERAAIAADAEATRMAADLWHFHRFIDP